MRMFTVNLNDDVKVRLTDLGKDIYYHQYDNLNRQAGRAICEPKLPRWIPVEERLPEKQGWCVACVFYRGIQWGDITAKGFTSVCPAYYFEGTFHKVSSEAEVTHWMPLPEPPKEE